MKNRWTKKPLDEVCEVEYGTRVVRKRDAGTIYPVYGGGGATFAMDTFNREDRLVIGRFGMSEQCTRFVSGEFFLNDSGLTLAPKNADDLSPAFLDKWAFSVNDDIFALGKGTAQKNLDVTAFRSMQAPLPPLPEQRRIVGILDEAFDGIATAKANAEKNIQNARALFESHLNAVFTQRGDGWVEKKLNDVCDLITCGVAKRPEYVPTGIPFLSAKNVKNGQIIWSGFQYVSEETHRTLTKNNKPKLGDILYTRVGSYGEAAIVDREDEFSVFVSLTLIKPKPILLNTFLKYYLNSPAIKHLASKSLSGSGVGNLNVGTIRQFPIPIPPIDEQKIVSDELEMLHEEKQRLESIYQRKLTAIDELKKSLLHQAFSGQL